MIFIKLKKNYFYIILSFFWIANTFLVGQSLPFKKTFSFSILFINIILSFFHQEKVKEIIRYFIHQNNNQFLDKISGGMSLISWVLFSLSLSFLNMGFLLFARWLFLFFIIAVIVGGVFVIHELWRSNDTIFHKVKPVFFTGMPILYLVTSTYAASYFLKFSNMNISDSPLLELGLKSAFFAIWFFVILQPIAYYFFLYVSNKFNDYKVISSLGVLFLFSFLALAILRGADYFIIFSLDWATNSEWRTSATCGSLKISESTERYFGFNTDKYTVYFSNRDGKWGFEELQCAKNERSQDSFTREPVKQFDMPKWFKD